MASCQGIGVSDCLRGLDCFALFAFPKHRTPFLLMSTDAIGRFWWGLLTVAVCAAVADATFMSLAGTPLACAKLMVSRGCRRVPVGLSPHPCISRTTTHLTTHSHMHCGKEMFDCERCNLAPCPFEHQPRESHPMHNYSTSNTKYQSANNSTMGLGALVRRIQSANKPLPRWLPSATRYHSCSAARCFVAMDVSSVM